MSFLCRGRKGTIEGMVMAGRLKQAEFAQSLRFQIVLSRRIKQEVSGEFAGRPAQAPLLVLTYRIIFYDRKELGRKL